MQFFERARGVLGNVGRHEPWECCVMSTRERRSFAGVMVVRTQFHSLPTERCAPLGTVRLQTARSSLNLQFQDGGIHEQFWRGRDCETISRCIYIYMNIYNPYMFSGSYKEKMSKKCLIFRNFMQLHNYKKTEALFYYSRHHCLRYRQLTS